MPEAKVLIVDDSELELEVVRIMLEAAGFDVDTRDSVFDLRTAIEENRPDVILLDVHMPALSGDRATQILKSHRYSRDIPVILFSSTEKDELEALVAQTGASDFYRKTGDFEGLAQKIRSWVPDSP